MVKKQKQCTRQKRSSKGFNKNRSKARKINASTQFETCTEQLSPFGGHLALIKFLNLIDFKQIYNFGYIAPARESKLCHYRVVIGLLMLLFIGFNRIWHFTYIRLDAMLCGLFCLQRLPVASTFWRYVDSMGLNQGQSLINITSSMRERVWKQLGLSYNRIHIDIDTIVETLYGSQQGGRKGHTIPNIAAKKATDRVLCFIVQTREYLLGKLRKGKTMIGKQTADFIHNNYAFFQVVMLAYNIWRYMKLMASSVQSSDQAQMETFAANTIRIARLKLLFIAAKVVEDQNRDKVKYSI